MGNCEHFIDAVRRSMYVMAHVLHFQKIAIPDIRICCEGRRHRSSACVTTPYQQVTIVDYGRGGSASSELLKIGTQVVLTDQHKSTEASRLGAPGVGAFGDAMSELSRLKLVEPLQRYAASGRPMLGICVGMQIMFEQGEEFGSFKGLGLLEGTVSPLPTVTTKAER